MRLLAVSHCYPRRSATGTCQFIHRLHRELVALGVDVHVLQLADWAPPYPLSSILPEWRANRANRGDLFESLDGVSIHHPAVVSPRPSRFFSSTPAERQRRALEAYCRLHPVLAMAHGVIGHFMIPDGYHALDLAHTLRIPALAMAWGDDLHAWPAQREFAREQLIKVLREVDVPIACSRRMVDDGNAWLAEPRDDWEVVYGGVDLSIFRPTMDPMPHRQRLFSELPFVNDPSAMVLSVLAQAVVAKGYRELLDSWVAVSAEAPAWRLVMAGGGWSELDMKAEIEARGLAGRAFWMGVQQGTDIPDFLRASNAFVLPSYNEGLSLSVLEALATGLPTVTTDVGGHAEVIRDGVSGWLIPPRDTISLTRALRELVSSDATRASRGRAGRDAAERIGSPATNAARLAAVLERAVRRGPAAARRTPSLSAG